tara:strand:- start:4359 stop:5186 length:828 start_codon:yes stop_codon:yes gene_type:complete
MAKFKHNKKRNSAFLYEVLIQELTKSVLSKNKESQTKIVTLVKETFSRNSMMYRELKLYRAITHTKDVNVLTAEKIVNEVKIRHRDLDKKVLLSEQNQLARKINKFLSSEAFSNFVPNYKDLASIEQIFNNKVSIKSKILLENELVEKMSSKNLKEKMVPMDNIVYNSFVKRFNNEYGTKLLQEQKLLLNKFIASFHNNGVELKSYLNEEIGRLKKELKKSFLKEELISDSQMLDNAKKVLKALESYQSKKPDKTMVEEVIKIQGLVKELNSDAN